MCVRERVCVYEYGYELVSDCVCVRVCVGSYEELGF